MSEPPAPWQEEVRGGYPDPRLYGLSGLEQMRASLKMGGPRPPISHLTGILFAEVDEQTAVFTLPGSEWFLSSQEHISAGALTMLADAALGSAIVAMLPPATPMTTWELSMTFLKPCPAGGTLRATGRLLRADRPLALSDVWVEDAHGELVAHGTSSCFVMPTVDGVEPPDELPAFEPPAYPTPDPWERPVRGEVIPWDLWKTMSGHALLSRQIAGELAQPPIHYLTGMTLREAGEGTVTFAMPASEWLASPTRYVQGGATAMLAHAAIATAVTTTLEAGTAYRPVDVKVHFLRPVPANGAELVARGAVTHRGRSLAVATADVVGADGKKVATATGSTMILPERASTA